MKKSQQKTILIVDDEPENRHIYAEILNDLGYATIEAPDGEYALSKVREGNIIDLVIADYRMPKMNGLQFIESLRSILPAVPMIMVTAFANVESYLQSFSLGVFEYMNKPFSKAEFVRIVKAALDAGQEAA
jgi:two-component system response regulator HydG